MNRTDIPVALVDDHTLVRKGLVELINSIGGYHVVLEAAHGRELQQRLNGVHVELAIVDLNMPVMDGYETLSWLTLNQPSIRALALTFEANDTNVIRALRNGARGFVLKDIEPEILKEALDLIHRSGYYHTDMVQKSLMNHQAERANQDRARSEVLDHISPRELDFLVVVCSPDEPTYESIAVSLGVHRRTVDGYRESLFTKFGIKSKTGLVLFAIKWGIIKV